MSVIEYQYQRATHEQLVKCLRWCQNQLQLRDWLITLDTNSVPPKGAIRNAVDDGDWGCSFSDTYTLKASIWVNLDKCKADNGNATSVAIHEIIHVFLRERQGDDCDSHEVVTRILEPMLYRLYIREMGLKQARKK